MQQKLTTSSVLPQDHERAVLVGRAWLPSAGGPVPVLVSANGLHDLRSVARTVSELLELESPVAAVRAADHLPRLATTVEALANTDPLHRDPARPWLLAPCDLQALKASGVTFVSSMLERVIEEQARGDASKAADVRAAVVAVIGDDLAAIKPGSAEAMRLKDVLIAQGAWSQYLEVGIGPDAEIFTKAQPMSAVGCGVEVGIHPKSVWNNPEPEIVLAVNSRGQVVGAALGNDVNLRDFEGRSALLLGKAKDNNASCAIGPFIRLFDADFTLDDVRRCDVLLHIAGPDGFVLEGKSSMSKISRDPLDLVAHAIGPNHRYPDGFMLFLGTMFAPTQDRAQPGQGFTHMVGDVVTVHTPRLGALINRVNHADKTEPWTFGVRALLDQLTAS
ncbi:MAG: fumarylacetoacetate hydrolase family protein [Betaproteobacteria bacterium]|nr:fumarylacetoacetate hydrolase family protein [Betaproteobacteria bacterium]